MRNSHFVLKNLFLSLLLACFFINFALPLTPVNAESADKRASADVADDNNSRSMFSRKAQQSPSGTQPSNVLQSNDANNGPTDGQAASKQDAALAKDDNETFSASAAPAVSSDNEPTSVSSRWSRHDTPSVAPERADSSNAGTQSSTQAAHQGVSSAFTAPISPFVRVGGTSESQSQRSGSKSGQNSSVTIRSTGGSSERVTGLEAPVNAGSASDAAVIGSGTLDVSDTYSEPLAMRVRKNLFIGDSRTCCISNEIAGTYVVTNLQTVDTGWVGNDRFIAQWGGNSGGQLAATALDAIDSNTNVFILFGRNETSAPNLTAGYLSKAVNKALSVENTAVYFVYCGPDINADGSYDAYQFAAYNEAVNCPGATKLNPWDKIGTLSASWPGHNDTHYDGRTSRNLYNYLVGNVS